MPRSDRPWKLPLSETLLACARVGEIGAASGSLAAWLLATWTIATAALGAYVVPVLWMAGLGLALPAIAIALTRAPLDDDRAAGVAARRGARLACQWPLEAI